MKYILFFLSFFLCFCRSKENKIDLDFRTTALKSDFKKKILVSQNEQEKIDIGHTKVAKISIYNKDGFITIFTDFMYHFPINTWYQNGYEYSSTAGWYNHREKGCQILLKEKDSTAIYITYPSNADSFLIPLRWKRDSLGLSNLKFYKNKEGQMEFKYLKKMKLTSRDFDYYYKRYLNCGILPKLEDVVIEPHKNCKTCWK